MSWNLLWTGLAALKGPKLRKEELDWRSVSYKTKSNYIKCVIEILYRTVTLLLHMPNTLIEGSLRKLQSNHSKGEQTVS